MGSVVLAVRYERFGHLEGITGSKLWESHKGRQALQRWWDCLRVIKFPAIERRQHPNLKGDQNIRPPGIEKENIGARTGLSVERIRGGLLQHSAEKTDACRLQLGA